MNANSLCFNIHAGRVVLALYLDGETIYETSVGNVDDETDREITIDLSRYSSKQISRMYVAGTMESHESAKWAYGTNHSSTSIVQVKSITASY